MKFAKIKPLRNVKSLPFSDVVNSCSSHDFLTSQICLLTLFTKIKHLRNVKSLPFTDVDKSCSRHDFFNVANMSFNAIDEKKFSQIF